MIVRIPKIVPAASDWASTFGVDRRGVFSGVRLGDTEQLLRWIEPGPFVMGSEKGELGKYEDEGPIHRVTIPNGFWLGETPVTQQFYQAVTGENPSRFHGKPQHPVEQVSWEDATAFCEKLTMLLAEFDGTSARLPSEAEWEYACRAGTTSPLYSGKALTSAEGECPHLAELAWYGKNSDGTTHPVGQKQANDWGLYDMLGNVWEWCEDVWHDNYQGAPTDGSAGVDDAAAGSSRVSRGGSWADHARDCRCASRNRWHRDERREYLGFRFVLAATFNEGIRAFP
jgi:formylglycine-generating enzyme required for sulfatase activity